jgi:hypothetical protein
LGVFVVLVGAFSWIAYSALGSGEVIYWAMVFAAFLLVAILANHEKNLLRAIRGVPVLAASLFVALVTLVLLTLDGSPGRKAMYAFIAGSVFVAVSELNKFLWGKKTQASTAPDSRTESSNRK